MALPALGETYWAARGLGAWMRDRRTARRCGSSVSRIAAWADATLSLRRAARPVPAADARAARGARALARRRRAATATSPAARSCCRARRRRGSRRACRSGTSPRCQILVEEAGGTLHRSRRAADARVGELRRCRTASCTSTCCERSRAAAELEPHERARRASARRLLEPERLERRGGAGVQERVPEPGPGVHRVRLERGRPVSARVRGGSLDERARHAPAAMRARHEEAGDGPDGPLVDGREAPGAREARVRRARLHRDPAHGCSRRRRRGALEWPRRGRTSRGRAGSPPPSPPPTGRAGAATTCTSTPRTRRADRTAARDRRSDPA